VGVDPERSLCVGMTQSVQMRALAILLLAFSCPAAFPQTTADEPVTVSADHPRLLLRPQRLRLLRREKERESMRWQQFAALVAGNAPMPERGFALALYYQVAGDAAVGKQAVAWALAPGADLRQMALVYDWCQDALSEPQKTELAKRLTEALGAASDDSIATTRSRALAAIALFDEVPVAPQRELERIVRSWWAKRLAPQLTQGRGVARDDAYAFYELLHAVRDTTIVELRDCCRQFFKDFPIEHLLSYYPAVFEGPDTMYYIGAEAKAPTEPDLRLASLSRAAELAMVAYDVNAAESQVIQGWLMHDKFILKSPFGAPYEFLWANPYLPGLSYFHVPLIFHNPENGHLFIRSSWEDGATWFGYWDGAMQIFEDGKLKVLRPKAGVAPLSVEQAVICFAQGGSKFRVRLGEEADAVFVVGLEPRKAYEVEIDDEEMYEAAADAGGVLMLEVPKGKEVGLRFRPAATR
jgi:hypothetical protein